MLGSQIMASADPQGKFVEGIIASGETPYPGTILQIDFSVAKKGGRWTWKIYNRDADGNNPAGPLIVLLEDHLQGKIYNQAYAAGDRAFGYIPLPGDELNMIIANLSGTGDDHALGEILMVDDGTGKLIATTGSPESEPFVLAEAITDPTTDTWAHCVYSGY